MDVEEDERTDGYELMCDRS